MTIRDDHVQPSAPPQHFDISATPADSSGTAGAGYNTHSMDDPEIAVGPTAYATPIHDDHADVPIIQATTLPIGGGASGVGGPSQQPMEQVPPYYNSNYNSSTQHNATNNPVAVVTGPPQPPSVAVVTGAPQPPTVIAPYGGTSHHHHRSDGQKCCIVSAWTAGVICCLCCILPFIVVISVFAVTPEAFNDDFYDSNFDDDFFDRSFDDDFFTNNTND